MLLATCRASSSIVSTFALSASAFFSVAQACKPAARLSYVARELSCHNPLAKMENFMKTISRVSAALLSIVMINAIGSELEAEDDPCKWGCVPSVPPQPGAYPKPTVKAQGRVKLPGDPSTGAKSHLSICEAAEKARARNSPAAPGLEAKCAAAGGGTEAGR
jgi:hypothetical protein